MDKLQKIAYILGMGIAVSVFSLFLYSFLPHMIQSDQWDILGNNLSDEELLELFKSDPSYSAFYEKYPNAFENFENHRHGGELTLIAGSYGTQQNMLNLHMYYDNYDQRVNLDINCETYYNDRNQQYAHGAFVVKFIEETECLDLKPTEIDKDHDFEPNSHIDERGIVTITPRD